MMFYAIHILLMAADTHAPSVALTSHACLVLKAVVGEDNVLGYQLFYRIVWSRKVQNSLLC